MELSVFVEMAKDRGYEAKVGINAVTIFVPGTDEAYIDIIVQPTGAFKVENNSDVWASGNMSPEMATKEVNRLLDLFEHDPKRIRRQLSRGGFTQPNNKERNHG